MVRAGGSASRAIHDSDAPDLGGGHHPAWTRPLDDPHRPRWIPNEHAFPALGSLTLAEEKRSERVIPGGGPVVVERNSTVDLAVRSERNKGLQAPLGRNVGTSRRGMRPARISGPVQLVAPVHGSEVKVSSAVRPLSAEAAEFYPALVREKKLESGRKTSEQHVVCGGDSGKVPETSSGLDTTAG